MKINSIIIFILFYQLSCSPNKHETKQEIVTEPNRNIITLTEEQFNNAGLSFDSLSIRELSNTLHVNGKVELPPQNMVSVSSPLGGYLKSTKLLVGNKVAKGDVLAIIENEQFIQLQQDYLKVITNLDLVSKNYKRQKTLNESKSISDKSFEIVEHEYKMLQIELNSLKEKLSLLNIDLSRISTDHIIRAIPIYSPIHAYVSRININIGKYFSPNEVLFELINPQNIHLNLQVFEKDIQKIKLGQKIVAYSNDEPGIRYICKIFLINKEIKPDRTVDIQCKFEQANDNLLPGMYMNADIAFTNHSKNSISEEGIVQFDEKEYVFVENAPLTFEMIEIHSGIAENGFVEIKNAEVLVNKKIVIKSAYILLMALKNIQEE